MKPEPNDALAGDVARFLAAKRALGYPYVRGELALRSFVRYVRARWTGRGRPPWGSLLRGWMSRRLGRRAISVATELGPVRQFFLFRRRSDPAGFVPGREWAPQSTESHFVPYVLSVREVRSLLKAAAALRGPVERGRAIQDLIRLLYCTGLRPGEALRLEVGDVDLARHVLLVRASKGRTRWVPFRADLAAVLARRVRRRGVAAIHERLFLRPDGRPYTTKQASHAVRCLLRRLELKPASGRTGPRPFDLRHTFAVHRLTRWYREGVDIASRLPWLSAYMGHLDIAGTEAYLRATPALLAYAGRRLRKRLLTAQASL